MPDPSKPVDIVERLLAALEGASDDDAILALTHCLCEVAGRSQDLMNATPDDIAEVLTNEILYLMPEYRAIAQQQEG